MPQARKTCCSARRAPDAQIPPRTKVGYLELLRKDGKPVFAVEYLEARQQIERARAELLAYGFVPYFTDRALDTLR